MALRVFVCLWFIVGGIHFVVANKRVARQYAKSLHAGSDWMPVVRAMFYFLGSVSFVGGVVSLVWVLKS